MSHQLLFQNLISHLCFWHNKTEHPFLLCRIPCSHKLCFSASGSMCCPVLLHSIQFCQTQKYIHLVVLISHYVVIIGQKINKRDKIFYISYFISVHIWCSVLLAFQWLSWDSRTRSSTTRLQSIRITFESA